MLPRRAFFLAALAALGGCGWEPLYADRKTGPADAALRAIHVAPIAERAGQQLEWQLREAFNPAGTPTRQHYVLRVTLLVSRSDFGILIQGSATRGRLDLVANYVLTDLATGAQLTSGASHAAVSFDILANGYANIVAENDARTRAVEELRRDLTARLVLFFRRRAAPAPKA